MNHSSPAHVWRCFVLVFNGATIGVEEVRTQLKAHLLECDIYLDEVDRSEEEDGLDEDGDKDDLDGDEGEGLDEDDLHEDEDCLDEDGDEGGLDGDEDEDE